MGSALPVPLLFLKEAGGREKKGLCCRRLRILREKRLRFSDEADVAQRVNASLATGPAAAVVFNWFLSCRLTPLFPLQTLLKVNEHECKHTRRVGLLNSVHILGRCLVSVRQPEGSWGPGHCPGQECTSFRKGTEPFVCPFDEELNQRIERRECWRWRVRGRPSAGEERVDILEGPLGTRVVPRPEPAVDVDEPGAAAVMTAWDPRDGRPGGARAEAHCWVPSSQDKLRDACFLTCCFLLPHVFKIFHTLFF